MGFGGSLALITFGAILKFAVTKHVNGLNVGAVGIIFMLVGLLGMGLTWMTMNARKRTDIEYRPDGVTYVEPNKPNDPRI